jgi:hypothetical protein
MRKVDKLARGLTNRGTDERQRVAQGGEKERTDKHKEGRAVLGDSDGTVAKWSSGDSVSKQTSILGNEMTPLKNVCFFLHSPNT